MNYDSSFSLPSRNKYSRGNTIIYSPFREEFVRVAHRTDVIEGHTLCNPQDLFQSTSLRYYSEANDETVNIKSHWNSYPKLF